MTDFIKSHQRVALFVDVQNLFYSARQLFNAKVDYARLTKELVGGRQFVRGLAYVVEKPEIDQSAFYVALSHCGYDVEIKEVIMHSIGVDKPTVRGDDIDVNLTLGAISMAPKIDVAIIVSGSGKFTPLVYWLREHGVSVEVVAFERSISEDLRIAADKFVPIQQGWTIPGKSPKAELLRPSLDFSEDDEPPQPTSNVHPRLAAKN